MERELKNMETVMFMKEIGLKGRKMGRETSNMQMEIPMMEIG